MRLASAAVIGGLVLSAPAEAADEELVAGRPTVVFAGQGSRVVVSALCSADASGGAAWTRVVCTVDDSHTVIHEIDTDLSDVTTSGEHGAAAWYGSVRLPSTMCTHASAAFNQPSGPPRIVELPPLCRTIPSPPTEETMHAGVRSPLLGH